MTQRVNPPEDQNKIQIVVNVLLHHRNKTKIEQNNKCGIRQQRLNGLAHH